MTMNSGTSFGGENSSGMAGNSAGPQWTGGLPADPSVAPSGTSGNQSGANVEPARQKAGDVAQELKGVASQATTAVSDATRRAAMQAKDAAGRVVGQATGQARQLTQQLTQQATEQGATMFNDQKTKAAESLGGVASALRCAAKSLHDEHDKHLGAYTDSLADNVENAASYLRDADPRQFLSDAGNFARRRPEWVLGGAFIAGLALVRFLKASRSNEGAVEYDTGGAAYDDMGETSHLNYATSDQFMGNDEDLVSRYRAGAHPGIGSMTSDAGPDMGQPVGGNRDFARTNAMDMNDGPDVAITTPVAIPSDRPAGSNPDANMNNDDAATRVNPSTGGTF